jgi:hypothetical protein
MLRKQMKKCEKQQAKKVDNKTIIIEGERVRR